MSIVKPEHEPVASPEATAWAKQFDNLDLKGKVQLLEELRANPEMKHVRRRVLELLVECYQLLMENAYVDLKQEEP
jgi:hypothetical protein